MTTVVERRWESKIFAAPTQILIATDLTDGDYLIPHIVAQAKTGNARVTLVHAILPANSFPLDAGSAPYLDQAGIDREAQAMLAGMVHQIEAHGIACDTLVLHGFAADVVREALQKTGARRLIMGTHGRGKLGQFVLGSVANELLRTVSIPIFTVGPHADSGRDHSSPRRLLHPVSLEQGYRKSFGLAVDLARSYGAQLTLLHVLRPGDDMNPERTLLWAKNALAALVPRNNGLMYPVQMISACGPLITEILKAAVQVDPDWILLGVDGDFPFWSFRDATAYKVLASANCPVLTVRHDPRPTETDRLQPSHFASVLAR